MEYHSSQIVFINLHYCLKLDQLERQSVCYVLTSSESITVLYGLPCECVFQSYAMYAIPLGYISCDNLASLLQVSI